MLFSLSLILICLLSAAGTAYHDLELIFFLLSSVAFLNRGVFFNLPFSSLTWKQGQSPNMGILKLLTFYIFSVSFKVGSHQ